MDTKGEKFEDLAVAVTSYKTHEGKKGPFTRLGLRTREGDEYESVYWDGELDETVYGVGKIIVIGGLVDIYKDKVQLKIKKYAEGNNGEALNFLPRVPPKEHSMNLMLVGECVKKISHDGLRGYVKFCIKKWSKQFSHGTGAVKNHHAMVGGYVKHVAEMILIGERLIDIYIGDQIGTEWVSRVDQSEELGKQDGRQADADLVRASLPLHDWGKMEEYSTEGAAFIVTKPGELLSHPGITPWRLAELRMEYHLDLEDQDKKGLLEDAAALFVDEDMFLELLHVIGAHHGQVQYNAPSSPKMIAAMIVHIADYASCFMDVCVKQCYAEGERGTFTKDRYPNPDNWKKLMRS